MTRMPTFAVSAAQSDMVRRSWDGRIQRASIVVPIGAPPLAV